MNVGVQALACRSVVEGFHGKQDAYPTNAGACHAAVVDLAKDPSLHRRLRPHRGQGIGGHPMSFNKTHHRNAQGTVSNPGSPLPEQWDENGLRIHQFAKLNGRIHGERGEGF